MTTKYKQLRSQDKYIYIYMYVHEKKIDNPTEK